MSRGALRRRRSNAVGSASPTSTPRCPSRHCTAPGKGLHRARRGSQRRRCPANRDLRGSGSGCDQRCVRVVQGTTRSLSPARERRPPCRRLGAIRPRADSATDRRNRLSGESPQRECHRDRRMAVLSPRCDPARHDRQDRATARASVAPAADHDPARGTVRVGWPAKLAIAKAMAVESQTAAGRPCRRAAVDARTWPGELHRGRCGEPPLDVERVMNDSWTASGRFQQGRPGARRRRCL